MPAEWDFADIYREHRRKVYNLCAYLLNSRDAAEDAVHEVFLRVHRRIETYDPSFPFSNWILKVASNLCVDLIRRRGAEKVLFGIDFAEIPQPSTAAPSPLSEMLLSETGRSVRLALQSLPDKFRVPLVLAYYNEFTYDEIAATLHVPRNTVATLLFRGRQLLRLGGAFLAGFLLFWLFPATRGISLETGRSLLTSAGVGFLVAVSAPVAAVILAITLIGIPVAVMALGLWLLGLYLAKIVIGRCLGNAIMRTGDGGMTSVSLELVIGLIIVIVAVNLPFIGGILNLLLILIGFGALVIAIYQNLSRPHLMRGEHGQSNEAS